MTTIPKSAHSRFDLISRLTREIQIHKKRFILQPRHFHDRQARKIGMEKNVHLRGIVLELLREQDEEFYKCALTTINSEIDKEEIHA